MRRRGEGNPECWWDCPHAAEGCKNLSGAWQASIYSLVTPGFAIVKAFPVLSIGKYKQILLVLRLTLLSSEVKLAGFSWSEAIHRETTKLPKLLSHF